MEGEKEREGEKETETERERERQISSKFMTGYLRCIQRTSYA